MGEADDVSRTRRRLARMPIYVYRMGLGSLFGHRLLLLTHTGRVSGKPRKVVLEVVAHDRISGAYLVASGLGARSQWYRNVLANPDVRVQIGDHRFNAVAHVLSPDVSGQAMADYGARHPWLARLILRVCGLGADGGASAFQRAGRQQIHFVNLTPR